MSSTGTHNQSVDDKESSLSSTLCIYDRDRYRELCRSEENIPIFSQDWWLDAACGTDRWKPLLIESNNRIMASMPLYFPLPSICLMPDYTQTLGLVFHDEIQEKKYSSRIARRHSIGQSIVNALRAYSFFDQRFHYSYTDWLPFYWDGYKQTTRYTYVLDGISDQKRLNEQMSQNIRRNIRKAQDKFGITVRKGISIDELLRVQNSSFDRQEKKNKQSEAVLRRLIEAATARNQGDIWGGYDKEGRLHAAVFVVWQPSSAYYIAGGGDSSLRHSGAHALVLWKAIQDTSAYTDRFDFEGSMLPGVERFFREFGATQYPYFAISKGKLSLFKRVLLKLNKNG